MGCRCLLHEEKDYLDRLGMVAERTDAQIQDTSVATCWTAFTYPGFVFANCTRLEFGCNSFGVSPVNVLSWSDPFTLASSRHHRSKRQVFPLID